MLRQTGLLRSSFVLILDLGFGQTEYPFVQYYICVVLLGCWDDPSCFSIAIRKKFISFSGSFLQRREISLHDEFAAVGQKNVGCDLILQLRNVQETEYAEGVGRSDCCDYLTCCLIDAYEKIAQVSFTSSWCEVLDAICKMTDALWLFRLFGQSCDCWFDRLLNDHPGPL